MKIVILSDQFENGGGAANVVRYMAEGLKKRGHKVSIITSTQNKEAKPYEHKGIKVFSVYSAYNLFWRPYLSLFNPQTIRLIRRILKQIKPDIVHAHNIHIHLSYHALKLAQKSGAKVFLTAHDVMLFHYGKLVGFNYKISVWQQIKRAGKTYNPLRNIIIRHYLKYVDKIFAVSDVLKDALMQNGIKNVEVIHNGINVDEWAVDEQAVNDFKSRYNLNCKKIILFGGRLSELKGGKQMITAMPKIINSVNNAILLIIGETGGYVETMKELAKQKGLKNYVIFTGWLSGDELKAAYHVADVVVMPSICFDSFPMVNLEAMACRKPVVATCFGGSREAVLDGETGFIINPFNIEMMADKIVYFLSNPNIAKKFGEAGYERIKKEFSLEKMTENYLKWYKKER